MYCPECGNKCTEIQQCGMIWHYECESCEVFYGYNGYVEPPVYDCYGDTCPISGNDNE